MYDWTSKINKCVLAGLRAAAADNGVDRITGRTCQDIREYLAFSTPFKFQDRAYNAIKKINDLLRFFYGKADILTRV